MKSRKGRGRRTRGGKRGRAARYKANMQAIEGFGGGFVYKNLFPKTREELHHCTYRYVLRSLARQLYSAAKLRNVGLRKRQDEFYNETEDQGRASSTGIMQINSFDRLRRMGSPVRTPGGGSSGAVAVDGRAWPPPFHVLEAWTNEIVAKLQFFRSILIPLVLAENENSLLRQAYRAVLGPVDERQLAGAIAEHFRREFKDPAGRDINVGLRTRQLRQSEEIRHLLDTCWTAATKSVGPHVLNDGTDVWENGGSQALYENIHLRLCNCFPREKGPTRQALPDVDFATDHSVVRTVGGDSPLRSFPKRSLGESFRKITELVVGPYDKTLSAMALKLLYGRMFFVATASSLENDISIAGYSTLATKNQAEGPGPNSLRHETSLLGVFLATLLSRGNETVRRKGGRATSAKLLLETEQLHADKHVNRILNIIWKLVDVKNDGVVDKGEYSAMYHKLFLLQYAPRLPPKAVEATVMEHDWVKDLGKRDFAQGANAEWGALNRKQFVKRWFTMVNDEFLSNASALEFATYLNFTFSQVATHDAKRGQQSFVWRTDKDIVRRRTLLHQYPKGLKRPSFFFKRYGVGEGRAANGNVSISPAGGTEVNVSEVQVEATPLSLLVPLSDGVFAPEDPGNAKGREPSMMSPISSPGFIDAVVVSRGTPQPAAEKAPAADKAPDGPTAAEGPKPAPPKYNNASSWVSTKFEKILLANRRGQDASNNRSAFMSSKYTRKSTGPTHYVGQPQKAEDRRSSYGSHEERGREVLLASAPPWSLLSPASRAVSPAKDSLTTTKRPSSSPSMKRHGVAGPATGHLDPFVREQIIRNKDQRARSLHGSQLSILNGLQVSGLVNMLSKKLDGQLSRPRSATSIARRRANKKGARPKSAARMQGGAGFLSKSIRDSKGSRQRPMSASPYRVGNRRNNGKRAFPSRPPKVLVASPLKMGKPPSYKVKQRKSKSGNTFLATPTKKVSVADPSPWEVFHEGNDFRDLSYGQNGNAKLNIKMPKVFATTGIPHHE